MTLQKTGLAIFKGVLTSHLKISESKWASPLRIGPCPLYANPMQFLAKTTPFIACGKHSKNAAFEYFCVLWTLNSLGIA